MIQPTNRDHVLAVLADPMRDRFATSAQIRRARTIRHFMSQAFLTDQELPDGSVRVWADAEECPADAVDRLYEFIFYATEEWGPERWSGATIRDLILALEPVIGSIESRGIVPPGFLQRMARRIHEQEEEK